MKPQDFIYNRDHIRNKLPSFDSPSRLSLDNENFVKSAVTFLLIPHDKKPYELVLILRTINDKDKHSGEMGFPGGKYDPQDKNLEETALRECEEELGIPRTNISVLGCFDDHLTPKRFIITPFVVTIDENQLMTKNDDEVNEIVKIPVDFFAQKKKYIERTYNLNEKTIAVGKYYYHSPNNKRYRIFGATCHLIVHFMDLVYDIGLQAPGSRRLLPHDFEEFDLFSGE